MPRLHRHPVRGPRGPAAVHPGLRPVAGEALVLCVSCFSVLSLLPPDAMLVKEECFSFLSLLLPDAILVMGVLSFPRIMTKHFDVGSVLLCPWALDQLCCV